MGIQLDCSGPGVLVSFVYVSPCGTKAGEEIFRCTLVKETLFRCGRARGMFEAITVGKRHMVNFNLKHILFSSCNYCQSVAGLAITRTEITLGVQICVEYVCNAPLFSRVGSLPLSGIRGGDPGFCGCCQHLLGAQVLQLVFCVPVVT